MTFAVYVCEKCGIKREFPEHSQSIHVECPKRVPRQAPPRYRMLEDAK